MILQKKPGLVQNCYKGEGTWSNDDDEEHFIDYPAPDKTADLSGPPQKIDSEDDSKNKPNSLKSASQGSWVHRANFSKAGQKSDYDPYIRNPLYTHAETECTPELHQLVKHYHPTVRLYATMLLKGQDIKYDGDPVKDFTLARFLDRFVYKNPKKNVENVRKGQFKKSNPSGIRAVPINSAEYLEIGEQNIPEDEKFFYRYFKERALRKEDEDAGDNESIDDDEFDAYLDGFEKSVDKDNLGDLHLDFASDQQKSKANQVKKDSGSDFDEDDDDEIDLSDEELAAEFREEMGGLEDTSQFSPDKDDELQTLLNVGSNKKKKKNNNDDSFLFDEPKKKKKKADTSDLFASAEQFAHLLDEDNEMLQGGTNDVLNKDKAAQKQLDWERTRHHRLQDTKRKKKQNSGNKKSKSFVHRFNK
ncbi:hypothetical protein Btru_054195 [Bulinus truncatus]|nr:hypothetical protein Btru_054195 [Bulinus truncatus]